MQIKLLRKFVKNKKKSFIVSTGRTGTKLLESVFSSIGSSVIIKHELGIGDKNVSIGLLKNEIDEKHFENYYIKSRSLLLIKNYGKLVIEANGNLLFSIKTLLKQNKNIRVALIIRDPKNFVNSASNRIRMDENGMAFNVYLEDENWELRAYEIDDSITREEWTNWTMPMRFIWFWNLKNTLIDKLTEADKRVKVFRFEDLMSDYSSFREFTHYISFDRVDLTEERYKRLTQEKVNTNPISKASYQVEWDKKLKEFLYATAGQLMKKYNYE